MRHDAEGITTDRFPAQPRGARPEAQASPTCTPRRGRRRRRSPRAAGDAQPDPRQPLRVAGARPARRKGHALCAPCRRSTATACSRWSTARRLHGQVRGRQIRRTDEPLIKDAAALVEERAGLPMESFRPRTSTPCVHETSGCRTSTAASSASRATWPSCAPNRDQVAARFQSARITCRPTPRAEGRRPRRRRPGGARQRPTPPSPARRLHRLDLRAAAGAARVKVAGRGSSVFRRCMTTAAASRCAPTTRRKIAEHAKSIAGLARLFALELSAQVKAIEKLSHPRAGAQFIATAARPELKAQLVTATPERCLPEPLPALRPTAAKRPGGVKLRDHGGGRADAPVCPA